MAKALIVPNGIRFNHLTVIKEVERDYKNRRQFLCKCDCGNEKVILLSRLKNNNLQSCGCYSWVKPKTDIEQYRNKRYEKLVILDEAGYTSDRRFLVKCVCDCGKEFITRLSDIKCGKVTSCGCKRGTHDGINKRTTERLYSIWKGMKDRCYNPNYPYYYNYGGRGIKICNQWVNDYPTFRKWALSNGYSDELTIERIDVNGDYEPSNCKWATMMEQSNNKRGNIRITYNGETHTPTEWSRITGISAQTIRQRYHKNFALDVVFSQKRLATRATYEKREKTT